MHQKNESVELRPDWRLFLVPFIIGVLLIPALGAGVWVIYHFRKKWRRMRYRITNSDIRIEESGEETLIPLYRITLAEVQSSWLQKTFGLGTIVLQHEDGREWLQGLSDPGPIAVLIEKAAFSERERMKIREEVKETQPPHPSGTLDKKNELVGLWQQGLISEADYLQELKKFE